MSKENDQTQDNQEDTTAVVEEQVPEAAMKTSEDFDKKLDEEGVEDTPPSAESDDKSEDTDSADDKDAGQEDTTGADDKGEDDATEQADEPKVSEAISKRALDIGLTQEEIATFSNDADLEKTVSILESVVSEPDETADAETTGSDTGKADEKAEDESVLKFENEDDIDPELLKNIKSMESHYKDKLDKQAEQIDTLSKQVNEIVGQRQSEERQAFVGRFDKMIDDLGLEWADTFGKGKTTELGKRSPAYKARDTVRARMHAFGKGLVDSGQELPEESQLFSLAINSLYGDKAKTIAGARSQQKASAHTKGARVGRAASKKSGKASPHARAVETSRKFDDLIDMSED